MPKRIGILTGGGDCPGLNPAIRGAVIQALELGYECWGIEEGWKGLIEARARKLALEDVEGIVGKGGTILGTSRTNPFKKEKGVEKVLLAIESLGLHALIAMGGEDTLGVARRLHKEHQVRVVGVPKTMDNDLSATDYTFGFDTAASIAVEAAERLIDTGKSHRRAMVLEVMGREAGWVALFTGIAAGADYIAIPEKPFDEAEMARQVKDAYARKKYALIITSEALRFAKNMEGNAPGKDDFGHVLLKEQGVGDTVAKMIEKLTGIETRAAVIGHIQRGGPPTLFDRILATRVGIKAAQMVHTEKFGCMAALKGNEMVEVSLEEAVGAIKKVSPAWIKVAETLCQGQSCAKR
jgi:6-phosphofructokinase 1